MTLAIKVHRTRSCFAYDGSTRSFKRELIEDYGLKVGTCRWLKNYYEGPTGPRTNMAHIHLETFTEEIGERLIADGHQVHTQNHAYNRKSKRYDTLQITVAEGGANWPQDWVNREMFREWFSKGSNARATVLIETLQEALRKIEDRE